MRVPVYALLLDHGDGNIDGDVLDAGGTTLVQGQVFDHGEHTWRIEGRSERVLDTPDGLQTVAQLACVRVD